MNSCKTHQWKFGKPLLVPGKHRTGAVPKAQARSMPAKLCSALKMLTAAFNSDNTVAGLIFYHLIWRQNVVWLINTLLKNLVLHSSRKTQCLVQLTWKACPKMTWVVSTKMLLQLPSGTVTTVAGTAANQTRDSGESSAFAGLDELFSNINDSMVPWWSRDLISSLLLICRRKECCHNSVLHSVTISGIYWEIVWL